MASKITLFCFLALFVCTNAYSQELIAPHHVSGTDTVPSNEIWKVESILYTDMSADAFFSLNGIQLKALEYHTYKVSNNSAAGAGMDLHEMKLPFWLNSDDVIGIGQNVAFISVLRFTKPD